MGKPFYVCEILGWKWFQKKDLCNQGKRKTTLGQTLERFTIIPYYTYIVKTEGLNLFCNGDVTSVMKN